jgi:hypothetical protein
MLSAFLRERLDLGPEAKTIARTACSRSEPSLEAKVRTRARGWHRFHQTSTQVTMAMVRAA